MLRESPSTSSIRQHPRKLTIPPTKPPLRAPHLSSMPPCIVDLSQDSDDDEFYVAPCSPFRPSKRSPPPPQQAPPFKKQSLRTPMPVRNGRPTSSSSSSSVISFVSPRKIQQSITSFFPTPNIKSEKSAVVQKPITSFFSSPHTKSGGKPARASRLPMSFSILFSEEHVRVDNDEAPTPAEFQVYEFHPSQPPPKEVYLKCADGLTPATPVLLTSSPPDSPTDVMTSPKTFWDSGGKRRVKQTKMAAAKVVPSSRVIKQVPKKRSGSVAFGSSPCTEDKGSLDLKFRGMSPKVDTEKKRDISMRYKAMSSLETIDHSSQTGCYQGRPDAAKMPSIQPTGEIMRDQVVDRSTPDVSPRKTNLRKYPIDSRPARFIPSPQKADLNATQPVIISTSPPQEVNDDFEYTPQEFGVTQMTCASHDDPDCDDLDCVSDFYEEYSPYHDTLGGTPAPVSDQPTQTTKPPPTPALITKTEDLVKLKHEYLGVLLASGTLDAKYRRPYLSRNARDFLRNAITDPGMWKDLMSDCDGALIHAQFTVREIEVLATALLDHVLHKVIDYPEADPNGDVYVDIHNLMVAALAEYKGDGGMLEHFLQDYVYFPMHKLPGREKEDCVRFLVECFHRIPDVSDSSILVDLSARPKSAHIVRALKGLGLGSNRFSAISTAETRVKDIFSTLEPYWKFSEGSSDIHEIVWSSDGTRFGMATTCFNDGYNRPGNLMLGSVDPYNVKMLYRHAFRVRQQALGNLERFMYATVSSIRFSNDSNLLYSASYDGFIKVWNVKDGKWLSDIPLKHKIIVMANSPITDNLIAAGCSDGSINVLRLDAAGTPVVKPYVCHINKSEETKKELYPSCLAWGNEHVPNWLIVGYDTNTDGGNHGGLAIFDVERKVNLFKGPRGRVAYPTRHFDIAMHSEGVTFVTSSADEKKDGSVVRLFDIRDMVADPVCFKSVQKDVNKVTISPCQNYITSSGTNGSTFVWDTRFPDAPLVDLKHGKTMHPTTETTNLEEEDTGVTFAQWGRYSDRFFTGGSDGVVKMWDISLDKPFLKDIAKVPTQIMSAAFSPTWDELIVGECSGAATLFSARADKDVPPTKITVDWTEDEEKMSPDDDSVPLSSYTGEGRAPLVQEEEPETGARFARELVEDGSMWIDGKFAWATKEYTEKMERERKNN